MQSKITLRQAAQRALKAMEDGEDRADMIEFSEALIALRTALAEPEQEPVAWGYELATTVGEHGYDGWSRRLTQHKPNVPEGSIRNLTPLYNAPTPRKPLTDDRVWLEYMQLWPFRPNDEPTLAKDILRFARAIEKAHGIGEQHE